MNVTVLYGTETGNAELCADSIAAYFRESGDAEVHDMADVGSDVLGAPGFYVFVTSTFGEGELPAGTETFFSALTNAVPELAHVRFAVFGLGDSFYGGTFNRGGHLVAEKLVALGADMVGEVGCYDTSTGEPPGDAALEWVQALPVLQEA